MALPSSQLPEAVVAVNQDLRDISSWGCAHSLLINPDKTKLIFVGVLQLTRSISTLPPVHDVAREGSKAFHCDQRLGCTHWLSP